MGDLHVIEAPGDVALEYVPAGVGSRFVAALIDHLILALVAIVLLLFLATPITASIGLPILTAFVLVVIGGFAFVELRYGRTPGKAVLGLRVIREDGEALDARAALIRNILRLADFLPALYFVGLTVMSLEPKTRRLGDLLAGTVVVREAPYRPPQGLVLRVPARAQPSWPHEVFERIALTPEEYQALRTFCFRTRTMELPHRRRLARALLLPLHARAGLRAPGPDREEELLVDLIHHLNGTFGAPPAPHAGSVRPGVGGAPVPR